jgi:hypothetical protein
MVYEETGGKIDTARKRKKSECVDTAKNASTSKCIRERNHLVEIG